MSDDLTDPADVPVEAAQDAVEPTSAESVPWSEEEYDRERAYNTIQNLRRRETDLEKEAKQFERLQTDPDAFREFVSQRGYELPDEDTDPADLATEDDPIAAIRGEIAALKAERAAEQLQARTFETAARELKDIQKDAGRELTREEIETLSELARPDNEGVLHIKPVWDAMQKLVPQEPRKPARPPSNGSQGTEKFDIRDPEQRLKRMTAIIEAGSG